MDERPERADDSLSRPSVAGNLSRKAASGMRWTYLAALVSAVVQVGYVAGMARLLDPVDFGLMAMAQIAVNFGLFFSRMGLTQTIIQMDDVSHRDLRLTATTSILLGLIAAGGVAAGAPGVAALYDEPSVAPVVRVLAVDFVLIGAGITSFALLRRSLRFREIGIIQIAATVTSAGVGLEAALLGAGVYSLVAATLAGSVLTTVLMFLRSRHSLRPLLRWREARGLYASGARFSALRLTEFVGRNLDTVAVGRYLTPGITGIYSRVYTLTAMPLSQHLSLAFAKVLFPSFAAIQNEPERLTRATVGALTISSLVLIPTGAGMAAAAPDLVAVVLGSKFTSGASLVPYFAAGAVLYVLSHLVQIIWEATGELNRTIGVQLAAIAALLGGLALARTRDVAWFAGALVLSEVVRHVMYVSMLRRVVSLSPTAVLRLYLPGVVAAIAVVLAVLGTRTALLELGAPDLALLVADIAVGGIVLLLSIRLLPFPWLRRELWRRVSAVGLSDGRLRLPVRLVLGRSGAAG